MCVFVPLVDVEMHDLIDLWLFSCQGGGRVEVAAADFLALPYPLADEIYAIKGPLFDLTYQVEDHNSYWPTKEETRVTFTAELDKKAGCLYRRAHVVFAKANFEGQEPAIKGINNDDVEVELWI